MPTGAGNSAPRRMPTRRAAQWCFAKSWFAIRAACVVRDLQQCVWWCCLGVYGVVQVRVPFCDPREPAVSVRQQYRRRPTRVGVGGLWAAGGCRGRVAPVTLMADPPSTPGYESSRAHHRHTEDVRPYEGGSSSCYVFGCLQVLTGCIRRRQVPVLPRQFARGRNRS
jgi:hypothetical protein